MAGDIIDTMLEGIFEFFSKVISFIFKGIAWLFRLIVQNIGRGLNKHKSPEK